MNEELIQKYNIIVSFWNRLSKQTEYMTSINIVTDFVKI